MKRITVVGHGCKGLGVQMLDDAVQTEDDSIVTYKDEQYIVDKFSQSMLNWMGEELTFIVPVACVCGSSEVTYA